MTGKFKETNEKCFLQQLINAEQFFTILVYREMAISVSSKPLPSEKFNDL